MPKEAKGGAAAKRCRRKFLRFFPDGFRDETYIDWERGYKENAHGQWEESLGRDALRVLLKQGKEQEIAARAVRIEGRTNLLFSFEKMALRDSVKSRRGAQQFAEALHVLLHRDESFDERFSFWIDALGHLPRKQARVLTWPVASVFPFIAQPKKHLY